MTTELQSQELTLAKQQVATITEQADALMIADDGQAEHASVLLRMVADTKNSLEAQRQFFVRPLNDQVKRVNDLFKAIMAPLLNADSVIRGKVMDHRRKQQELARLEQERLEKQAAKEQAKLDKKAEKRGVAAPKIEVPIVPTPVKTMGNMTARKVWKWRLVDFAGLPDAFKEVNATALNDAVRKGERTIAGVEIYEDEILAVR